MMCWPGATRASDCSMLWPCSCGNQTLLPNQLSAGSSKNSCERLPQIGRDGLPRTKTSGRTMVEALTIRSEEIASRPFDELNFSQFMAPHALLWPIPAANPPLNATEVHV